MFKTMSKEINAILRAQTIFIWTYVPYKFLKKNEYGDIPFSFLKLTVQARIEQNSMWELLSSTCP